MSDGHGYARKSSKEARLRRRIAGALLDEGKFDEAVKTLSQVAQGLNEKGESVEIPARVRAAAARDLLRLGVTITARPELVVMGTGGDVHVHVGPQSDTERTQYLEDVLGTMRRALPATIDDAVSGRGPQEN